MMNKKKNDWDRYVGSHEWIQLKYQALLRAGFQCESGNDIPSEYVDYRCKNTTELEMHHDTYPSHPSYDSLDNVRILCRSCHEKEHMCSWCGDILSGEDYRLKQDVGRGICFSCFAGDSK